MYDSVVLEMILAERDTVVSGRWLLESLKTGQPLKYTIPGLSPEFVNDELSYSVGDGYVIKVTIGRKYFRVKDECYDSETISVKILSGEEVDYHIKELALLSEDLDDYIRSHENK